MSLPDRVVTYPCHGLIMTAMCFRAQLHQDFRFQILDFGIPPTRDQMAVAATVTVTAAVFSDSIRCRAVEISRHDFRLINFHVMARTSSKSPRVTAILVSLTAPARTRSRKWLPTDYSYSLNDPEVATSPRRNLFTAPESAVANGLWP